MVGLRARSSVKHAVGASLLMWTCLASKVAAESEPAATSNWGPWGLGGCYLFGFFAGFAIYGFGVAMRSRKSHLAEVQK
ncbi:MAG: hypothetical protein QM778_37785 [Myxococcales bacterium]